jgi:uncharacterized membrane protein YdjX (TVP38/TMEM64 family)
MLSEWRQGRRDAAKLADTARPRRWLFGLAAAALVGAALAALLAFPPARSLHELRHWLLALGPAGVGFFVLAFIAATLILAPDWPLAIVAGLVYGLWGVPVVVAAATVAASLAFLLARYVARDRVRRLLAARPKLAAVDRAVAAQGWKVVLLMRLSPLVPFNLQNYLYGITGIRFAHYVPATMVGIAPATTLYVYFGMLGKAAVEGGGGGPLQWALLAMGLVATAAVALLIARKARAALAESERNPPRGPDRAGIAGEDC